MYNKGCCAPYTPLAENFSYPKIVLYLTLCKCS